MLVMHKLGSKRSKIGASVAKLIFYLTLNTKINYPKEVNLSSSEFFMKHVLTDSNRDSKTET